MPGVARTRGSELTEHLQRLWDHFSIPDFHRQLYLKRYCSGKYQSDVLVKEVQSLAKGKAVVQRLMKAIESREEVLLRLTVLRGAFKNVELREPGSLARCQLSEQLYCLRMSTAEVVKLLHSWRLLVAPVAGSGCVAGPGSRGACWPHDVPGGAWEDYLMYIMRNDSVVRSFEPVAELSPEIDPLLLFGAVGGRGPFQRGKLCPPCGDLQLRQLEHVRLILLEEELSLVLFDAVDGKQLRATSPSRPSSRLVEELTAPLELSLVENPSPRPPSRPRPTISGRPRGSVRRTEAQKEEPMKPRRSLLRRKKKSLVPPLTKTRPLSRPSSRRASVEVESKEAEEVDEVQDMQNDLRDLINAFQVVRKKSVTDFQGVPKLVKAQTAATDATLERAATKKEESADDSLDEAVVEKELTLRCGIEVSRVQSVWNRFENDNVIHHDVIASALARIGFVGPEKTWVEEIFRKTTEFTSVSREEFLQIVDSYDDKQRETFHEKFIRCDADGSGQMDLNEFGDFLRTIGIEPMKHVLQECFEEFDKDQTGQLSFDDFYELMRLLAQREGFSKTEVNDFAVVFNKFDPYHNDEIDVKELQQVLTYVGIPIELEECTEVANIVDLDDSGFVDFQEFLMCMRLFRDRELAELKKHLQALGDDGAESIPTTSMLTLLQRTGYVADQEVVDEVLLHIEVSEEEIGLGSLWKFLVTFRQREGLTLAEILHARQAFHKYAQGEEDDLEEFREVLTDDVPKMLRLVGYTLALEDQKQLVGQVDIDRSGTLSLLELLKLVRFIREKRTHELQAILRQVDRSESGQLSEKEVIQCLRELGCLREDQSSLPEDIMEDLHDGFMSFPDFSRCVRSYDEMKRKQLILSGGYTFEQMEQLKQQFGSYDWDNSGDVSKKELVQLIIDVFPDMAFDPDKRPLLLQIMRETDADRNGKLDFTEFLQLMRTVEDLGHLTQLQKERTVVEQTGFTPSEVSDFRSVFLAATNGEARMSLSEFKEMMSPICPMGDKNSLTISSLWMEICDMMRMCDFPDYLLLMRRLIDMNFADMNDRLRKLAIAKARSRRDSAGL